MRYDARRWRKLARVASAQLRMRINGSLALGVARRCGRDTTSAAFEFSVPHFEFYAPEFEFGASGHEFCPPGLECHDPGFTGGGPGLEFCPPGFVDGSRD